MDVRRSDRQASLASVAGELEMEEQGDGAKLLKSKASALHAVGPAVRGGGGGSVVFSFLGQVGTVTFVSPPGS